MGKGNIGTEMLGRIVRAFPQLNLVWLCTGDGSMTVTAPAPAPAQPARIDLNEDYKKAYEGAMMQVMALNRILKNWTLENRPESYGYAPGEQKSGKNF